MNRITSRSARTLFLSPVIAVGLMSALHAQTAKPAISAASMPSAGMQMQTSVAGSDDMKRSMMTGMDNMQKMPMSGDTDKDFAMMMKIHHQGALDMARMELAQGKSAQMKAMAKNIIATQKKEMAQFDKWLAGQK